MFLRKQMPGFADQAKNRREFAPEGAPWSKFDEFAEEFAAIRTAEFAEKLHQRSAAQPPSYSPGLPFA
jgi:hypothetical protein